ncbi:MAG: alpha/beta hydrolase [Betaproteobacteria bacterium]|nr:alpha/beta hydrolase [Betaproteobacteria bacterium]MBI2959389.1 alpha/beta hydrolase [Betaproteobacteria bacterium]
MTRTLEWACFRGGAGRIEAAIEAPQAAARGIALVAHPHPLYGGTLNNKVVQTLAKVFVELGYLALRPNFRGAGASEGEHDHGEGETGDLVEIAGQARERFGELPLVLAGFSFGAYVQTRVANRLAPERVVLIAPPSGFVAGGRSYRAESVPPDTIVIHGERDQTVPLANVLDWVRPLDIPIVLVPDADHFFHRRLHLIKSIVRGMWKS